MTGEATYSQVKHRKDTVKSQPGPTTRQENPRSEGARGECRPNASRGLKAGLEGRASDTQGSPHIPVLWGTCKGASA